MSAHPAALPDQPRDRPWTPVGFPVVGVIGDGQLARMMQSAAIALGVRLSVLAQSPQASACQVVPDSPVLDLHDAQQVLRFADSVDVLTMEHEHVPAHVLSALSAAGVQVRPGQSALAHAQNKLVMRARLADLQVPVPPWQAVHTWAQVRAFAAEHGHQVVLKTPTGGYDGKGVLVLEGAQLAGEQPPEPLARWWQQAGAQGLLAEQKVDFRRELAVLVARSPSGQAAAWPVVQTTQVDGICREVIAPAPDLAPDLAAAATAIGLQLVGALDVVGVLAVELFEVAGALPGQAGSVLVNELAMRPHNSGHWSIDGAVTGQFEQHLRAVLDLPLGDPRARSRWSVMVNVLGGDYPDLYRSYLHVMARDPGVKVHLYGKEVRTGRKVGHVTVCGDDLAQVQERARHAADFIQGVIDE